MVNGNYKKIQVNNTNSNYHGYKHIQLLHKRLAG